MLGLCVCIGVCWSVCLCACDRCYWNIHGGPMHSVCQWQWSSARYRYGAMLLTRTWTLSSVTQRTLTQTTQTRTPTRRSPSHSRWLHVTFLFYVNISRILFFGRPFPFPSLSSHFPLWRQTCLGTYSLCDILVKSTVLKSYLTSVLIVKLNMRQL